MEMQCLQSPAGIHLDSNDDKPIVICGFIEFNMVEKCGFLCNEDLPLKRGVLSFSALTRDHVTDMSKQ